MYVVCVVTVGYNHITLKSCKYSLHLASKPTFMIDEFKQLGFPFRCDHQQVGAILGANYFLRQKTNATVTLVLIWF